MWHLAQVVLVEKRTVTIITVAERSMLASYKPGSRYLLLHSLLHKNNLSQVPLLTLLVVTPILPPIFFLTRMDTLTEMASVDFAVSTSNWKASRSTHRPRRWGVYF